MAIASPLMGLPNQIQNRTAVPAGVAPPQLGAQIGAAPVAAMATTPMTTTVAQQTPIPVVPNGAAVPPTGLIGAEQAINTGVNQATGILGNAVSTIGAPNAYTTGGANAAKLQADISGANGPEAQRAAMAADMSGAGMDYQLEIARREAERTAAAKGGLLGGNVIDEVARRAQGIYAQGAQDRFNNLGTVADRGAQMQSQADQIKAGLTRDIADTAYSAGIQRSGLRTNAGLAIAQNANNAAASISQILKDQGMVVSDMTAKDISTITDIIYNSGLQQSMDDKQLAAILANIAGGQGSTVQQGQAAIGDANAAGTIGVGNAIQGGIGQALGAGLLGGYQQPVQTPVNRPINTTNNGAAYGGYA